MKVNHSDAKMIERTWNPALHKAPPPIVTSILGVRPSGVVLKLFILKSDLTLSRHLNAHAY